MKKSVLAMWESHETILKCGNHGVKIHAEKPVRIVSDKTLENEEFNATREFTFFGFPICVVNDNERTFRLSHAGVYATDKTTNEVKEGEWPKTTTQTLMMYRDLACGEGYTEIEPIEGRAAIDWRAHMEEYKERKAMMQAGIIPPRKPRTRKPKVNEAMLEMLEKEFGLSREAVLAKMAPPAPALPISLPVPVTCTADMVHSWFLNYVEPSQYGVNVDSEHADENWWNENLPADEPTELQTVHSFVIDAEYIENLHKEKDAKKTTKAKKTTPKKKTTTKKTSKKTAKKSKKEVVA